MDYHFGFAPSPYYPFPGVKEHKSKQKVTGIQRKAANERERKRMNSINKGFDVLRGRLPVPGKDRKLSKVDTLKFATKYIEQLRKLLEEPREPAAQSKIVFEANGEENPPNVFVVSWRKTPEKYGGIHHTSQGATVYQKGVWYPGI